MATPMLCSLHSVLPNVLVIRGEIDMVTHHEVGTLLSEHLSRADGTLNVDLSEVTFFAAAGVHMLLAAAETARGRGVTLRIGPLSHSVEMVLDATGTRTQLDC